MRKRGYGREKGCWGRGMMLALLIVIAAAVCCGYLGAKYIVEPFFFSQNQTQQEALF